VGKIPYKKVRRDEVKLLRRQKAHGYREPDYPFKFIPEKL
jgi:polyphosphate kinase